MNRAPRWGRLVIDTLDLDAGDFGDFTERQPLIASARNFYAIMNAVDS
jgi:hypothetical protein